MSRYDSDLDHDDWLNAELSAPPAGDVTPRVCYLHAAVQPCEECQQIVVHEDTIERTRRLRRPV